MDADDNPAPRWIGESLFAGAMVGMVFIVWDPRPEVLDTQEPNGALATVLGATLVVFGTVKALRADTTGGWLGRLVWILGSWCGGVLLLGILTDIRLMDLFDHIRGPVEALATAHDIWGYFTLVVGALATVAAAHRLRRRS